MYRFLYLLSIIIASALTLYIKPRLISILRNKDMIVSNYSGKDVTCGGGLIFIIPCMVAVLPFWKLIGQENIIAYLVLLLSMTLVGYLDDSLGEDVRKGFKGHLKALMTGCFSTGILKITFALIIGFIISRVYYSSILAIVFNTLLFSLSMNFINLLDLRPGRAIKSFALVTLFVSLSSGLQSMWILLPIYSSLTIYIKDEMEELCMLGDTGANLLGGILGMYVLKEAYPGIKYTLFILLLILHIIAEFKSFSKIIDSIPILKYMDSFGQLKKERS